MKKIILITGGSKGIGKATAQKLNQNEDYIVVTCSKTEPIFCDVRHYDHVKSMIDFVMKRYGRIDVLINCAGILGPMGRLEDHDINDWKDTVDVNLMGTVNCVHQVIPIMKKQEYGRIITFCGGGVGGDDIPIGFSAYNTSKFAIAGFTEVIAKELDFFDITINAVSPGAVDTEMARQRWVKGGSPDKVIELIEYLITTNKHINGKFLSAKWDNYKDESFENKNLFTLRRVTK